LPGQRDGFLLLQENEDQTMTMNWLGRLLGWGLIAFCLAAIAMDLGGFGFPDGYFYFFGAWALASASFAVVRGQMFVYVARRLIEAVFVIFIIATFTFLLLRFLPGGPFDAEKALPPEIKANIEAKYGLNKPLFEQYKDYLVGIVTGDLGESY